MKQINDKIICRGLRFECSVGFHDHEEGVKQKIDIDLEVWVSPLPAEKKDKIEAIRFDYYKANEQIASLLEKQKFNLVETIAEEVAELLLNQFSINAVQVSITKRPIDMPNAESVSYICHRER